MTSPHALRPESDASAHSSSASGSEADSVSGHLSSGGFGAAAAPAATLNPSADAGVLKRLWTALREVEDPEIPVSLVDMGLVVSVAYDGSTRSAQLEITYTAMGCPAMDMIQDDIRARLLREPDVERVDIAVVWDPVWTHRRLSESARHSMRELGLAV
ncbi:MAG TPA: metal-sulfur cluster assembly factor [Chloroflexota bacterium]|nr:metal-sulfur cluster assembly factor [Chloroflexota bacterium]